MFFNKAKEKAKTQVNDDKIKVDTSTITTMVGADTVFEGVIDTKASIRINGTVRGEVRSDGVVILTKSGHIEGTIEAESIIVAGRIDGNMSIRDKVNVEPSGQIYGEIITKKFVNDEESVFEGNVVMNRDGKVMPVTPYKPATQIEREEKLEKELREKIEKELKEKAEKEEEADSDKKDKDKDKNKDKKDKKSEKDSSDKKEDKDGKSSDDKDDDNDKKSGADGDDDDDSKSDEQKDASDKEDDSKDDAGKDEQKDTEPADKDSEIIIADINEIKDGEDIPKTEAKDDDDKKGSVVKSKSLSVEMQDE